jgi:hypothetical protein
MRININNAFENSLFGTNVHYNQEISAYICSHTGYFQSISMLKIILFKKQPEHKEIYYFLLLIAFNEIRVQ